MLTPYIVYDDEFEQVDPAFVEDFMAKSGVSYSRFRFEGTGAISVICDGKSSVYFALDGKGYAYPNWQQPEVKRKQFSVHDPSAPEIVAKHLG